MSVKQITKTITENINNDTTITQDNNLDSLISTLQDTIDLHKTIPKPKKHRPKHITNKILTQIKKQHKLHEQSIQHPSEENTKQHHQQRNTVNNLIKRSLQKHITKQLEQHKHNPKQQWHTLQTNIPRKKTPQPPLPTMTRGGHILTTPGPAVSPSPRDSNVI